MNLLLNDTSEYHYGCKAVIASFEFDRSIPTDGNLDQVDFSMYNHVILNGEGTMHHRRSSTHMLFKSLKSAQVAGCKTYLVNSVWESMDASYTDVLRACDRVIVREVLSRDHMKSVNGIEPEVAPDRSIIVDVPYQQYDHVEVYEGQQWKQKDFVSTKYHPINIFKQDWNEMVNRLRHAELLITGRHHEMYAAIKARCRFIVSEGNTWKNRGLLATVGVKLPTTPEEALSGKYDQEYAKVFDYCNEYYTLHNPDFML